MFEEDSRTCYMCYQPCVEGIYCSSECRQSDTGYVSPKAKAAFGPAPVQLTSRLPLALSPRHRPTHPIGPSPKMPPHVPVTKGPHSSSSSSNTSSPIHSPRTNPSGSGSDSPLRDSFNLPPPAFSTNANAHQPSLHYPGSMPVRIPNLAKASYAPILGQTPTSQGGSIETLHFGRKPSVTNSVISPNALLPRCACGKVAGHFKRRLSKDRGMAVPMALGMDSGFAHLSLGPSLTSANTLPGRVVSAPPIKSSSGHSTPRQNAMFMPTPLHTVSSIIGASQLSRSRSDPIQNSPPSTNVIAPFKRQDGSLISPVKELPERADRDRTDRAERRRERGSDKDMMERLDRRGRSLERQRHEGGGQPGVLNQVIEREQAPSRSRHRRDEKEREQRAKSRGRVERDNSLNLKVSANANGTGNVTPNINGHGNANLDMDQHAPISPSFADNPTISPISPSWSRQTSPMLDKERARRHTGGNSTPVKNGGNGSGQRSPQAVLGDGVGRSRS